MALLNVKNVEILIINVKNTVLRNFKKVFIRYWVERDEFVQRQGCYNTKIPLGK